MNCFSWRANLVILPVILLCLSFTGTTAAQSPVSKNTATLTELSANPSSREFRLILNKPEIPVNQIVSAFLSKHGIVSCTPQGNTLLIVTEPSIGHEHLIDVVDVTGLQNTYRKYREEYRANKPAPVRVEESK
ncbi:MAG: hypothetical protein V4616_04720 [Bacteroidota bacterium]